VPSSKAKDIIQLRHLLAEKFPGVRMSAEPAEKLTPRWPTGVAHIDTLLKGGLAKSALTEIVSTGSGCGSTLFSNAVLRRANQNNEWLALVDSHDSFDPAGLDNDELSRLLWVRCTGAKETLKAADLLLHDGTLPLLVIDLISCPLLQLRKIPASTWFRLERIAQATATACLFLTPEPLVSPAETRLILERRFTLAALESGVDTLLSQINASLVERSRAAPRFAAGA